MHIQTHHKARPKPAQFGPCSKTDAHTHGHVHDSFVPRVRESVVEVPHAAMEVYLDYGHANAATGVLAGTTTVLAGVRAYQNLRQGGTHHNIEGAGNVALALASGLTAYEMFTGGEEHGHAHEHSHGLGPIAVLEGLHGAAEIATGVLEVKEGRPLRFGLTRIAKGAAVVGAQLLPDFAPGFHLAHLAAALATTALDPTH